jgi:recombination protein RecA
MLKREMLSASKGIGLTMLQDEEPGTWLTSPAYDLNRILSGNLFKSVQTKNHIGIVGPEASGKSSFMCIMLADAQKKGYLPVVIDAEGAWTRSFVTRWGLDDTNVLKLSTMWVDDIIIKVSDWITAGHKKLAIAIDSIGALDVKKLLEDGAKGDIKTDMGKLQREIKRLLKMIVNLCKNNDCICFSAGHYYGNSSGYGDPEQIGGGKYYRLSCDAIISLKKSNIWENPNASGKARGEVLGNCITAATLKNRTYPPFQEAVVEIDYKTGVNSIAGIVKLAIDLDIIIKGGSWYTCDTLGIKAQGEAKLIEELKTKDLGPMLDLINKDLETKGYSSVNKNVEDAYSVADSVDEQTLTKE